MSEQFDNLSDELCAWMEEQPMFFVASAGADGHINLSPKGQDSLSVINNQELLWLNLTGSGNETAAHLLERNRMTMMWCSFAGPPRILRVYGQATTIHPRDSQWQSCEQIIAPPVGARQYFKVDIQMVQTSCGYAVPLMDYQADRDVLHRWAEKRGPEGIEEYWQTRNQTSLDGHNTGILADKT